MGVDSMRHEDENTGSRGSLRRAYFGLIALVALLLLCFPALVGIAVCLSDDIKPNPAVEFWFPATGLILFLIIPLLLWQAEKMRKQLRGISPADVCKKCGYDLRATPYCCPECGTRC